MHALGDSLQSNRKTREGGEHPDRDAQFDHLKAHAKVVVAAGDPVVSVDAKKKELVGDFQNAGREWHPQGDPEQGRVSDVPIPELGRTTPDGVDDLARTTGWVNVGIDHETASFAVESIRRWWNATGHRDAPQAGRFLISADGGGSHGSRVRVWKWERQHLADETGRSITVCHLPPGTSTWNTIEPRLFSFLSQNWRGKPLTSAEVIITLSAATTTRAGLTVQCQRDTTLYPSGRNISDEDMATLRIQRGDFHGEWNSTILPRRASA